MRWVSWLIVIVLCIATVSGLGYYKYAEINAARARAAAFPEPAESVEVYIVERIQRTPALAVTGEVVATRSAELRTELNGRIVRVGFEPGARVVAGQILLQLDVSEEQAQLAEARAEQQIARLALDRAERLVQSGAGSVENRDQARARYDASHARVQALAAVIEKKTVRAPFDGVAGLHQLEQGQFLDAGVAVTRLVGTSDAVWVDFSLPQEHAHIDVGSEVSIYRADTAARRARVIARDATVSTQSRNLRLRAELPHAAESALLPGMLVQVEVRLAQPVDATVVPATAVRRDAFGPAVYVLEEVEEQGQRRMRARKRQIEVGVFSGEDETDDLVVVLKGLQAGERIAAIGAFKLRDGALVVASEPNPEAENRLVGH